MPRAKTRRSRKGHPGGSGKSDARARRTRDALGDALVELMQQRPFDEIRVHDVLERAGVGRSTFYDHFRNTHDLFHSDADDFFSFIANALADRNDPSDRVVPVREFFSHLRDSRALIDAIAQAGKLHENFSLAQDHFARGIERRLGQIPRAAPIPAASRPAISHAQAGALMSLARFWISREMKDDPARLDRLFHEQFWGGADAIPARSGRGAP